MERAGPNRSNQPTMKPSAPGRRHAIARPLKLPHEHDESPEPSSIVQPVIRQAQGDIAAGRMETDNYTRAASVADAASKATPRKRPRTP